MIRCSKLKLYQISNLCHIPSKGIHSTTARVLLGFVVPGQLLFAVAIILSEGSGSHTRLSAPFLAGYVLAAFLQVHIHEWLFCMKYCINISHRGLQWVVDKVLHLIITIRIYVFIIIYYAWKERILWSFAYAFISFQHTLRYWCCCTSGSCWFSGSGEGRSTLTTRPYRSSPRWATYSAPACWHLPFTSSTSAATWTVTLHTKAGLVTTRTLASLDKSLWCGEHVNELLFWRDIITCFSWNDDFPCGFDWNKVPCAGV